MSISVAKTLSAAFVASLPQITQAQDNPFPGGHHGFLVTTDEVLTPSGLESYCDRYGGCGFGTESPRIFELTEKRWGAMVEVNSAVNDAIRYIKDVDQYGQEEFWAEPGTQGDCEDYALAKMEQLAERGFPRSAVLMEYVHAPNGQGVLEGHAVVVVRTSLGDYVLDNMTDDIRPATELASFGYVHKSLRDPQDFSQFVVVAGITTQPSPYGELTASPN